MSNKRVAEHTPAIIKDLCIILCISKKKEKGAERMGEDRGQIIGSERMMERRKV